jgi:hypothetical protein
MVGRPRQACKIPPAETGLASSGPAAESKQVSAAVPPVGLPVELSRWVTPLDWFPKTFAQSSLSFDWGLDVPSQRTLFPDDIVLTPDG